MKIKTSELTGVALDWAVAQATGTKPVYTWRAFGVKHYGAWETAPAIGPAVMLRPYSTDRFHADPIIDREITELYEHSALGGWAAKSKAGDLRYGPTPLVAAMRCFVASKLGDEIDIPKELT
jgi:hypothetical protein